MSPGFACDMRHRALTDLLSCLCCCNMRAMILVDKPGNPFTRVSHTVKPRSFFLWSRRYWLFSPGGRALLVCIGTENRLHIYKRPSRTLKVCAGPDTNRSAGLHSFVVFTAGGETQGLVDACCRSDLWDASSSARLAGKKI